MSLSHRSSHYWLWFLLFGIIPLVEAIQHGFGANAPTYQALWLVGTGLVGLLIGNKNINDGKLAQPYDLLVGIVFTIAGIVGILGDFGIQTAGVGTTITHIGLSLGSLWPLLYTFLGLKSIHHGLGKG